MAESALAFEHIVLIYFGFEFCGNWFSWVSAVYNTFDSEWSLYAQISKWIESFFLLLFLSFIYYMIESESEIGNNEFGKKQKKTRDDSFICRKLEKPLVNATHCDGIVPE